MRTKSNILAWFLSFAAIMGVGLTASSCQPEGLTDNSEFSLYYPGITDIGPSTSMTVTPTWHGGTPSDFEIYRITLDGAAFTQEGEVFVIDPEKGDVSLQNTGNLQTGTYLLSIACNAGGKRFEFPDAINVNMMSPAPEGIKVTPALITLKLEEVIAGQMTETIDGKEVVKPLPTAQIVTEGEHISISKYLISKIYRDGRLVDDAEDFFELSKTGEISIVSGNEDFIPGIYEFDFIITTRNVNDKDERGLFPRGEEGNGFKVEITSAPMELEYEPSSTKAMAAIAFKSQQPLLTGSTRGILYSVDPEADEIIKANVKVDAATGVISLADQHKLVLGQTYKIGIKVHNDFGDKVFKEVLELEIVDYIEPITKFSYADVMDLSEGQAFENPVKEISGEEITFSFVNLDEKLNELDLDKLSGTVSAKAGHRLPGGTHEITVRAENLWGPEKAKEATFKLEIKANPNKFTTVNWGNNLDLKPADKFASQFRFREAGKEAFKTAVPTSDIPSGAKVTYEIVASYLSFPESASIDAATGVITYKHMTGTNDEGKEVKNRGIEILIVKVTAGEGELAYSKKFPVAFHNVYSFAASDGHDYTLEYTPFVIKANPQTGGRSGAVKIYDAGMKEVGIEKLSIDFKRNIKYFNLNGPAAHKDGTPKDPETFLLSLWTNYYAPKPPEVGSRNPISWWYNKDNKGKALGYIDNETGELVVNSEQFKDDNDYANGVLTAQCVLDIKQPKYDVNKVKINTEPLVLWLDTNF